MSDGFEVGSLIYDPLIYNAMNSQLGDLSFYLKWLPNKSETTILELCCGTGRLTIPIAEHGYSISGMDLTTSMLDYAKTKAEIKGLDINWIKGDMRAFEINESFDLIFIPFNSIHHLYRNADLFETLKRVKTHLKPNGQFIFDCFNPNLQFLAREKKLRTIASFKTEDDRDVVLKETMQYEAATQINRIEWHYFINQQFHSIQKLDMRLYFPQELDHYLESQGFQILHKFGDFEESPFGNNSKKQIIVCSLKTR